MRRILCLLCLLPLFCLGCRKDPALPDATSCVYKSTVIEIPDGDYGVLLDEGAAWNGERFTIQTYQIDREMGGHWLNFSKTYSFLPDGTDIQEDTSSPMIETIQSIETIGSLPAESVLLDNGDTLFTEVVEVGDGLQYFVSVRNAKGDALFSTDLAGVFRFDYTKVRDGAAQFGLLGAVYADGSYLTLTTGGLCAFDGTGTLLWLEDTKNDPTALTQTDAGILYLYGETYEQSLRFVDPATGELGESLTLPAEIAGTQNNDSHMVIGAGYDLYVKNSLALWGVDIALDDTGVPSCTYEKVIDWVNSDLSAAELGSFCIMDPHTMTAVWHDQLGVEENKLLLLTYVAPEDVVVKEEIQLAMLAPDFTMQRAVANFNKQSDTHRIVVTDYTIYEEDIRKTRFDTAMSAGSVPDLVFLMDTDGMVDSYSRAGLWVDLAPWMAETYGDELLGTVTKPYRNGAGQQFVLPTSPVFTLYWGTSDFGTTPTLDTILSLLSDMQPGKCLLPTERREFWYLADALFLEMVNIEAVECHFDSERFIEIYKLLATLESTDQRSETPLLKSQNINSVYSYVTNRMQGEYTVPVGIPNGDGKLYVDRSSSGFLAISAKSAWTAECYTFLDLYMQTSHLATYSLFTRQDVYDSIDEYADSTIFLTPAGSRTIPNAWLDDPEKMNGITGRSFQITKADADEYIAILDRIGGKVATGSVAYEIYREEIMDTSRTPEEVATALQSRIGILLSENS